MANNLYHFTTFIFSESTVRSSIVMTQQTVVEVYKDTLAPASLVGLVTMGSALFCSGIVGGIVDSTPRLKFVRCAVGLQKVRDRVGEYADV
jgi:iron-regulated transporter 1